MKCSIHQLKIICSDIFSLEEQEHAWPIGSEAATSPLGGEGGPPLLSGVLSLSLRINTQRP